jgi:hypothetical protein
VKALLAGLVMLLLTGCLNGCAPLTALMSGNGSYTYTEYDAATGKKKCQLRADSGRVSTGVNVKACDGNLSVSAQEVNQGNSASDLTALLQTVAGMAGVVLTTPKPAEPAKAEQKDPQ